MPGFSIVRWQKQLRSVNSKTSTSTWLTPGRERVNIIVEVRDGCTAPLLNKQRQRQQTYLHSLQSSSSFNWDSIAPCKPLYYRTACE